MSTVAPSLQESTPESSEIPSNSANAPLQVGSGMDFAGGLGMGLMSLEGCAVQFGILPTVLPRENCSVQAEHALRKLGRFPRTDRF